jgi:hypothetical protein
MIFVTCVTHEMCLTSVVAPMAFVTQKIKNAKNSKNMTIRGLHKFDTIYVTL